jgi:eukaryotic-like serine/threonine-protein kinase
MNQPVMDHWTTVKRIHQSALDIDPSERAAFVDESCGGDEALRREVQELLTYAAEAESFLEQPAVDVAPKPPGASPEATLVGRTISHYQVLSLLGAGGMGEVYLRAIHGSTGPSRASPWSFSIVFVLPVAPL